MDFPKRTKLANSMSKEEQTILIRMEAERIAILRAFLLKRDLEFARKDIERSLKDIVESLDSNFMCLP
jgi:hypothetical protein